MMIKAIFFDIDGTLISASNPRMKATTVAALQALRKQGVLLFVASGRHVLELEELHLDDDFHFDGYLLLNGGYCFNDDAVIYENKIDPNDVVNICKVISEYHLPALFIEKDRMYVNFVDERVMKAQEAINTSIPPISDHVEVEQIVQIDPYVNVQELELIMKTTKHCKSTQWHDEAYDIVSLSSGKKSGIKAFMKYYGLQKHETAAFGDGENDLEMFDAVGLAIAMNNAGDKIKAHADLICDDVDGLGICSVMEQLGLKAGCQK